MKKIRFFDYDYVPPDELGIIRDFLALSEEKIRTTAGEVYRITRNPARSDDFAHAVTYACVALWSLAGRWPDLAQSIEQRLTEEQVAAILGPEMGEADYYIMA